MARGQLGGVFRRIRISGHRDNFAAGAGQAIEAIHGDPLVLRFQHEAERICTMPHRFVADGHLGAMPGDGNHLVDREVAPGQRDCPVRQGHRNRPIRLACHGRLDGAGTQERHGTGARESTTPSVIHVLMH